MRTQRSLNLSVPLPPDLSPSSVVGALHTVDPIIRHLGTLARYELVPTDPVAVDSDPFFKAWDHAVFQYQFQDHIPLGPGLTKKIEYPAFFQLIPDGIRCRANAPAGVIVWSQFTVRQQQATPAPPQGPGSESSPASTGTEGEEYVFYEEALVEADSLLMPFVARSMAAIHRDLCQSVVDDMIKTYATNSSPP